MSQASPKRRRALRAAAVCLALALLCAVAVAVYAGTYSRADETAAVAAAVARQTDGAYAFGDASADVGLILYPGGKVAHTAYAPLAQKIAAEAGVLCAVPQMPLNLAVLDADAAETVMAQYPDVRRWIVGGHSLGGAMAASYAASHPERAQGVVLLAAYSTEPLDLPVLSVYGDRDTVLDPVKQAEYRANLPARCVERMLPGGNHAQFGNYGAQKGDSTAAISAAEQQALTAQAIAAWLQSLAS